MGNIKEPFLTEDRFKVAFTTSQPRYGFHLYITGLWHSLLYVSN